MEVGVDELAMTGLEGRALLDAAGVQLTDAEMDQLLDRTEGWPVGLYLAALALKAGGSREHAGVPFSGDDRLMAEYLRTELLAHLSARRGLVPDANFGARSNERAALRCGARHARARAPCWSRSRTRTCCSSRLDRQGEWYRYHHLFRDLLRAELHRREPELVSALHVRAAEWCEANRMPELAIDHAQAGGDADRVNRLMLLNAQKAFAAGRRETVRRWLAWFEDEDLVEQYPAVAVLGALFYINVGDAAAAERWAIAAEHPSAALAPRRKHGRATRGRPSGFFQTAARWRAGALFFAAFSVGTASTRCDVTWRTRSMG